MKKCLSVGEGRVDDSVFLAFSVDLGTAHDSTLTDKPMTHRHVTRQVVWKLAESIVISSRKYRRNIKGVDTMFNAVLPPHSLFDEIECTSANFQVVQNWKKWLINQVCAVQFRKISLGWRTEQRAMSWSSVKGSIESYVGESRASKD